MLQRLGHALKRTYNQYKPRYSIKEIFQAKHIFKEEPTEPKLLFSFNTPHDINSWHVLCDRDVGGFSNATFTLKNGVGVFEGTLDTRTNPLLETMRKSGYAAIKSPEFEPLLDLGGYTGLELRVRTDARIYVAQLKNARLSEDDLFQTVLPVQSNKAEFPLNAATVSEAIKHEHEDYKKELQNRAKQLRGETVTSNTQSTAPSAVSEIKMGEWRQIYVPFDSFVLTWRGYIEMTQLVARVTKQNLQRGETAVDPERIASLGLLMAERRSGPFRVEIEWIRAVTERMVTSASTTTTTTSRYTAADQAV